MRPSLLQLSPLSVYGFTFGSLQACAEFSNGQYRLKDGLALAWLLGSSCTQADAWHTILLRVHLPFARVEIIHPQSIGNQSGEQHEAI
ncbi:MAG: hypothetical protein KDA42_05630 [Planctomycetales bacterium]|nr:hypothetical protein [Planctomycetales bacterium]